MGGRGSAGGAGSSNSKFNNSSDIRTFLQNKLDGYDLGISKEKLAESIYRSAREEGMNVSILNEKYLTVTNDNGTAEFSFTKSKKDNQWKLTPMLSYSDVTTGRHNGVSMYRAAGQWFSQKPEAEWAAVSKKLDKK